MTGLIVGHVDVVYSKCSRVIAYDNREVYSSPSQFTDESSGVA